MKEKALSLARRQIPAHGQQELIRSNDCPAHPFTLVDESDSTGKSHAGSVEHPAVRAGQRVETTHMKV